MIDVPRLVGHEVGGNEGGSLYIYKQIIKTKYVHIYKYVYVYVRLI